MDNILSLLTKQLAFKIAGLIILLNISIHSEKCETNEEQRRCNGYQQAQCFCDCGNLNLTLLTMTDAEKESIVDTINELRNKIAAGNVTLNMSEENVTLPQAANMTVMQWDDELAEAASKELMFCPPPTKLSYNVVIQISQIKAIAIHTSIGNHSNAYLKKALTRKFFHDAKYFDVSLLTNYSWNGSSIHFTTLARHSSLFIGCAIAEVRHKEEYEENDAMQSVCYFAASDEAEYNMLYKPGPACSDCSFRDTGFNCSTKYRNLCTRPEWNISDPRTQKASYWKGYKKYTNTSLMLSPSFYLPIVTYFSFLVHNKYVYRWNK